MIKVLISIHKFFFLPYFNYNEYLAALFVVLTGIFFYFLPDKLILCLLFDVWVFCFLIDLKWIFHFVINEYFAPLFHVYVNNFSLPYNFIMSISLRYFRYKRVSCFVIWLITSFSLRYLSIKRIFSLVIWRINEFFYFISLYL